MLGTDSRYMYLNFSLVWGRYSMVERGARGVVGLMLIRKETLSVVHLVPFLVERHYCLCVDVICQGIGHFRVAFCLSVSTRVNHS